MRGSPDRRVLVFSDIEMGAGGAVDDFPHSPWLAERIRRFAEADASLHVDVVFNGDTFDLLKTSYQGAWPALVSAEVAVGKMSRIAEAHPAFFASLRDLLARRGDRTTIHFVAGNHDLELLFPEVQSQLRELLADDERVRFHGHSFELGRVHFEHGSQLDPLFHVEPGVPFLQHEGVPILNPSWASVALLERLIPLQEHLGHHDRLKPKKLLLEVMPELREYLSDLAWGYWTGDWWRDFFLHHNPVKHVSWTMLKEIVWRTVSVDMDVAMEGAPQAARRAIASTPTSSDTSTRAGGGASETARSSARAASGTSTCSRTRGGHADADQQDLGGDLHARRSRRPLAPRRGSRTAARAGFDASVDLRRPAVGSRAARQRRGADRRASCAGERGGSGAPRRVEGA
jgi:UDP-2,3-diacylglucosamine pyrophosphatase LpxH